VKGVLKAISSLALEGIHQDYDKNDQNWILDDGKKPHQIFFEKIEDGESIIVEVSGKKYRISVLVEAL
jgi:hypothetical protein